MTDDLVRRLRCYADIDDAVYNPWVYGEAADRIEKLTAALREIVGALDDPKGGQHVHDMRNASYIARKALDAK